MNEHASKVMSQQIQRGMLRDGRTLLPINLHSPSLWARIRAAINRWHLAYLRWDLECVQTALEGIEAERRAQVINGAAKIERQTMRIINEADRRTMQGVHRVKELQLEIRYLEEAAK